MNKPAASTEKGPAETEKPGYPEEKESSKQCVKKRNSGRVNPNCKPSKRKKHNTPGQQGAQQSEAIKSFMIDFLHFIKICSICLAYCVIITLH